MDAGKQAGCELEVGLEAEADSGGCEFGNRVSEIGAGVEAWGRFGVTRDPLPCFEDEMGAVWTGRFRRGPAVRPEVRQPRICFFFFLSMLCS